MTRDGMLKLLNAINGDQFWIGESNGCGSCGWLYVLNSEGVLDCGGLGADELSPVAASPMTAEEYMETQRLIDGGQGNQVDSEVIELLKAGCVPNTVYYRLPISETAFGTVHDD